MTNRQEIEWRTDAHGLLENTRYHDGQLLELTMMQNGRFQFGIAPVGGGWTDIELEGVGEYGFRDLTNGNIVVNIWIHRVREMTASLGIWNVLYSHIHSQSDVHNLAARTIKQRPDDLLFGFDTAFAGSFAARCSRVTIFVTPP